MFQLVDAPWRLQGRALGLVALTWDFGGRDPSAAAGLGSLADGNVAHPGQFEPWRRFLLPSRLWLLNAGAEVLAVPSSSPSSDSPASCTAL